MTFPDAPRVHYEINPLDEVICQLRFPAILKIEVELPSIFQEKIRKYYPYYSVKSTIQLPSVIPPELAAMMSGGNNPKLAHEFISVDGNWKLNVTREFIALTCQKYERWEDFKGYLKIGTDALEEVYAPSFYTRLGLRYRDTIKRSKLGISDKSWGTLLEANIAGALASYPTCNEIQHIAHELLVKLPRESSYIQVQHGLNRDSLDDEHTYIIDADLYTDKQTEIIDAVSNLDFLNTQARLFFRWCITKELHDAMRPRLLTSD